jgi:PknH-like extracellular domain
MRQPTAALGVAVICVLVAGCGGTKGNAGSTTTTRSMIPRPLVERELAELLLSPEQVNAAMGATGMTVTNTQTSMSDNRATMAPRECLAIDGAAEALSMPTAVFGPSAIRASTTAITSRTISSRRWCCFPWWRKPARSSMPPPGSGRCAASTPTRTAGRSGPSGRSRTRTAR